jgi:F0F1-type ATP synthase assembly protein I
MKNQENKTLSKELSLLYEKEERVSKEQIQFLDKMRKKYRNIIQEKEYPEEENDPTIEYMYSEMLLEDYMSIDESNQYESNIESIENIKKTISKSKSNLEKLEREMSDKEKSVLNTAAISIGSIALGAIIGNLMPEAESHYFYLSGLLIFGVFYMYKSIKNI